MSCVHGNYIDEQEDMKMCAFLAYDKDQNFAANSWGHLQVRRKVGTHKLKVRVAGRLVESLAGTHPKRRRACREGAVDLGRA